MATITFKGENYNLDFERFLVVKHYEDLKKKKGDDFGTFDTAVAIVYGGLCVAYKELNKTIDFTIEEVEDVVGCMKTTEVTGLLAEFNKTEGEVQTQA